jgi:hypothetical protein
MPDFLWQGVEVNLGGNHGRRLATTIICCIFHFSLIAVSLGITFQDNNGHSIQDVSRTMKRFSLWRLGWIKGNKISADQISYLREIVQPSEPELKEAALLQLIYVVANISNTYPTDLEEFLEKSIQEENDEIVRRRLFKNLEKLESEEFSSRNLDIEYLNQGGYLDEIQKELLDLTKKFREGIARASTTELFKLPVAETISAAIEGQLLNWSRDQWYGYLANQKTLDNGPNLVRPILKRSDDGSIWWSQKRWKNQVAKLKTRKYRRIVDVAPPVVRLSNDSSMAWVASHFRVDYRDTVSNKDQVAGSIHESSIFVYSKNDKEGWELCALMRSQCVNQPEDGIEEPAIHAKKLLNLETERVLNESGKSSNQDILRIHQILDTREKAMLNGDGDAIVSLPHSYHMLSVYDGGIYRGWPAEAREKERHMFDNRRYLEYRPQANSPMIQLSRDGTMAWSIEQREIKYLWISQDGQEIEKTHTEASLVVYEKRPNGKWSEIGFGLTYK